VLWGVLTVISHDASVAGPPDLEFTGRPASRPSAATNGAAMLLPQLAAQFSHDLRAPLSSIIAGLEMLAEELGENVEPAVVALLESTIRGADRMLRMLDQNMTIAPVAVSPARFDVDLDKVANQLALDVAPLLELAGATLKVGRLPVVRANPDEMYSVLQNLLTNAVKFTRPGVRPWVSISARQIPYGWRVSMTDNGIGIPPEHRMDVFTEFSRVNSNVEGHGIGLGTVARIIHALGGRVGADQAPSGGAEVWFELPASSDP
jgi:signal transduction histidine kinase